MIEYPPNIRPFPVLYSTAVFNNKRLSDLVNYDILFYFLCLCVLFCCFVYSFSIFFHIKTVVRNKMFMI